MYNPNGKKGCPVIVSTVFENKPHFFSWPAEIISCYRHADLKRCFNLMESFLDRGYYLAGFFSFEAGYGLEPTLLRDHTYSFPLLNVGCYTAPRAGRPQRDAGSGKFCVRDIHPSIPFDRYRADIARIRDYIAAGDVYQITYCLKMKFGFEGNPIDLFDTLMRQHPMPYPAYIATKKYTILSLSPELFIKKNGNSIVTKPMKGTWPRGGNVFSDVCARFQLKCDEKNRAENVMIADLLRNDLGRIGTDVHVRRLFEVSAYTSLYQMTSTVAATVDNTLPLYELFTALFPSGSVTGAPKVRAMEILRGLEGEERNIYTGAIGYITPTRDMFFNVPIRTILIENGQGEMGIGGGIIWDSTAEGEWAETWLKAKFLTDIALRGLCKTT
jgi:para-aminobenzoate synthetase/4-amino-4-deoxychorismate lyase